MQKIARTVILRDNAGERYVPLCLCSYHVGMIKIFQEPICIERECKHYRRFYLYTGERKDLNSLTDSINHVRTRRNTGSECSAEQ